MVFKLPDKYGGSIGEKNVYIILRGLISMCIDVSRHQDLMLLSVMYVSELDSELLLTFQILKMFWLFQIHGFSYTF